MAKSIKKTGRAYKHFWEPTKPIEPSRTIELSYHDDLALDNDVAITRAEFDVRVQESISRLRGITDPHTFDDDDVKLLFSLAGYDGGFEVKTCVTITVPNVHYDVQLGSYKYKLSIYEEELAQHLEFLEEQKRRQVCSDVDRLAALKREMVQLEAKLSKKT